MGTIKALLRGLQAVNLQQITNTSLKNTSDVYLSLNKLQLYSGFDADGDKITPKYFLRTTSGAEYATLKNQMNARPGFGTPDLFLTGNFYRGFKIAVGFSTIFVTSDDDKTDDLTLKYGPKIFGLTPYNRTFYSTGAFYTEFQKHYHAVTGLKFR